VARSFLILHGIANHRPPEHWQHQLADALRERGEHVSYPGLPDPDAPSLEVWRAELERLLAELPAGERVVVCHSLACLLWIGHAAAVAQAGPVDRVALVSPPLAERLPLAGAAFGLGSLDAGAVRRASRRRPLVLAGSEDPYNPPGAGPTYAEPLGAELVVLEGAGHITPDEGYGAWPAMLDWCDTASWAP
jgi:predicted alpha/beta hydrolase family esterase